MASKKVKIVKVISGVQYECLPKTSADNVTMNSGKTVESAISELSASLTALQVKVNTMEDKLDFDTVYMKSGNVTLNDGSGLNLVAVY